MVPLRKAALVSGSVGNASATRTFSRAAPSAMPHFQLSQWAQDLMPHSPQPSWALKASRSTRKR